MHPFRAVQIQNAEDRWRIRLRPYSHQRHASNCAKIHRDNTGLLSISVIETFHHEYRGSVLDDIVDNSMTGFEVRLRQGVAFAIHARSEEHTSELQSRPHLVCRLLLDKK